MIRSTSFYTISETQGLNRMDMENTGFPILAGKGAAGECMLSQVTF